MPGEDPGEDHAKRRNTRKRRLFPVRFHRKCVSASHGAQYRRMPCVRRQGQASATMDLGAACCARPAARGADVLRRRPVSLRSQIRRALEPAGVSPYDAVRVGILAMRMRVKICGITRVEDAQAAAAHGADAIGLVFYRPSPRCVSLERARQIVAGTPAFVATVAVLVNPSREEVEAVIRESGVTLLQFHGDETPDFCASFSRPYIKAARIRPELDLLKYLSPHTEARAWMLDAFHG